MGRGEFPVDVDVLADLERVQRAAIPRVDGGQPGGVRELTTQSLLSPANDRLYWYGDPASTTYIQRRGPVGDEPRRHLFERVFMIHGTERALLPQPDCNRG